MRGCFGATEMEPTLAERFVTTVRGIVGAAHARSDAASFDVYGRDALGQGHAPGLVVLPASTPEIAAIARLCNEHRVPLVVRGAESDIVSPETVAEMVRRIPDARAVTVERAGHLVPGDNPVGFIQAIEPFLLDTAAV